MRWLFKKTVFACFAAKLVDNVGSIFRKEDLRAPWFIASDSQLNVLITDRKAQQIKVHVERYTTNVLCFKLP